jgi:hypothetical protein
MIIAIGAYRGGFHLIAESSRQNYQIGLKVPYHQFGGRQDTAHADKEDGRPAPMGITTMHGIILVTVGW